MPLWPALVLAVAGTSANFIGVMESDDQMWGTGLGLYFATVFYLAIVVLS